MSAVRSDQDAFVLDTSAVLALIEAEDGAKTVRDIIARGAAVLPWIAALELHYITAREVSAEEADARLILLHSAGVALRTMDGDHLLRQASALKAALAVSLADALIAAVAVTEDATLVHKDPEYEALTGRVRMLALPFKPRARRGEPPSVT